MPVFKKVNKSFFKEWNSEMAYVLGFFAADGYITVNKRGGQFWSIQITDKALIKQIRVAVGAEHKIGTRIRKKKSVSYRLQIGSIEMCDDLRHHGIKEGKTKNLALPKIPSRFFQDFVRGYFDGDGNVWKGLINKQRKSPTRVLIVMFTSCSAMFLKDLWTGLRRCGLDGGSLYKAKKSFSRLQFSTRDALKLYDFMYNHVIGRKSSLFLGRKKKVFEEFIKMRL